MKKLFLLIPIVILIGCGNSDAELPKDEWYAGGNLHTSSLGTWSSATEKNKLATCADYVANVKDYKGDMEQLKSNAKEVMACIEESANKASLSSLKSNEIAASCILILGIAD